MELKERQIVNLASNYSIINILAQQAEDTISKINWQSTTGLLSEDDRKVLFEATKLLQALRSRTTQTDIHIALEKLGK